MLTNDILRRVRYALNISDAKVRELFSLAGYVLSDDQLASIFRKEDEAGFTPCPGKLAHLFFRGLILLKRGKKDGDDTPPEPIPAELTNNDALWYIRIALQLKDEDIVALLQKAEVAVGKSEINALFRKKGHKNYMPCGDQFLRNFLAGLTSTFRP